MADADESLRLRPDAGIRRLRADIAAKAGLGPQDPAVAVRRGLLRIAELEELYRLRNGAYTPDAAELAALTSDMDGIRAQLAAAAVPGTLNILSDGRDFLISAEARAPGRPLVSVRPADVETFARSLGARGESRGGTWRDVMDVLSFLAGMAILVLAVPWRKGWRLLAELLSPRRAAAPAAAPRRAEAPAPAPPDEALRAAAAARAGNYEEAMAALLRKRQQRLTLPDYCLLFELYLRLGDLARAGLVLSTIDREVSLLCPVERGPAGPVPGRRRPGAMPPAAGDEPGELLPVFRRLARLAGGKARPDLAAQLNRLAADCFLASRPPAQAQREYYDLAAEFEADAAFERAAELYALTAYQDAARRRERAKALAAVPPPRPPAPRPPAPPAAPGRPAAPALTLAGRYELRSTVAAGGMGVVYEGLDRRSGLSVAVKQMHSYLKEYPEELERFRKEAAIVGRLSHPNIVAIYELLEQAGEIYLVFEYVAGRNLYSVLKEKKRLPLEECKRVFAGVCEAVHYAHENSVIHRDLKPPNIMLADSGKVMVMDFGLACTLRDGLTRVSHDTRSGTPAYMAPEQHDGEVRRESDVYSMGVCLYEMLTGSLPFPGMDSQKQKLRKDYREAGSVLPWLPAGVDAVISRALAPEPSQRYAGAPEFWAALKDL